ncbi:type II glyceraldehyde-3-phosphate dehydrogenase [Candidatus Woesearchaeota archaeon]|nr:type II glyceraldehyde-3-phosphate dehydrogenase [Candidatus Woesearchaeota archaeon]
MRAVVVWGGCGTVGQRVRDAILEQDDMTVYGVVTRSAKESVLIPHAKGIRIFTTDAKEIPAFKELGIADIGTLDDLWRSRQQFDIIVDCTPEGEGAANVQRYYRPLGIPAILQGGEEHAAAEMSFNATVNFDDAKGKRVVRVVSCNTTGSLRVLHALDRAFGIRFASASIDRRGNDPHQSSKLPRGSISKPSLNSHHGPDIVTVMSHLSGRVKTKAKKSDKQEFHSHEWSVVLGRDVTREEALSVLRVAERVLLLSGRRQFEDDGKIRFWAKERFLRGDIYESIVWPEETVDIEDLEGRSVPRGPKVRFDMLVDQQCIVVPEIVDAIRAMLGMASREESILRTNRSLAIGTSRARDAPVTHGDYTVRASS